jgi:SAM-dependent methyltransferase
MTEERPSFYDISKNSDPPRETLLAALDAWKKAPGLALDLGCGAGRDSLALLARGWRVYAIDANPDAFVRMQQLVSPGMTERLTTNVGKFDTASLPSSDLINASFALPFCHPDAFPGLWRRIEATLRPGGLFCGQLFGDRDSWRDNLNMTFHSRTALDAMLQAWQVISLQEEEYDGFPAIGPEKHWHLFHVVARYG